MKKELRKGNKSKYGPLWRWMFKAVTSFGPPNQKATSKISTSEEYIYQDKKLTFKEIVIDEKSSFYLILLNKKEIDKTNLDIIKKKAEINYKKSSDRWQVIEWLFFWL